MQDMIELSEHFAAQSDLVVFHHGRKVLDPSTFQVLRALSNTSSIQDAVNTSGIPYRTAWEYIRNSSLALGREIVKGRSGGAGGGETRLTPAGRMLLSLYSDLREEHLAWLGRVNERIERDWALLETIDEGANP